MPSNLGPIFLLTGLVLIAGLYFAFRPQAATEPPTAPPVTTPVPPAPTVDEFVFIVAGGQVSGPASFQTTQGREVVIKVTADVSDEVHLHGYNLFKDIAPTTQVEIRFTAETAGRFELELEQRHLSLGFLEVLPQ